MNKRVDKIQQGDVVFQRVPEIPQKFLEEGEELTGGRITLALGEATGHAHVVQESQPGTLIGYRIGDVTFLKVDETAIVNHNTHHDPPLEAGTIWRVTADGQSGSLQEFDHLAEEVRQLED